MYHSTTVLYERRINGTGGKIGRIALTNANGLTKEAKEGAACSSAPRIFYLSSSQLSSLLSLTARINPGQVVKEFPPTGLRPPAADSSAIYSPLYFLPRVFTSAWKSSWKKKKKKKEKFIILARFLQARTIDLIIDSRINLTFSIFRFLFSRFDPLKLNSVSPEKEVLRLEFGYSKIIFTYEEMIRTIVQVEWWKLGDIFESIN